MENNTQNSPVNGHKPSIWSVLLPIVVIIVIVYALTRTSSSIIPAGQTASSTPTTPTSSSSQPTITGTQAGVFSTVITTTTKTNVSPLIYSLITAKQTFAQNEKIGVVILVQNTSAQQMTLSFKNGCQASYTIGDFDGLAHTRCLPDPTTVTIPAGGSEKFGIEHYPSVYTLPVGSYVLKARIIGYGGGDLPITITK